MNWVSLLISLVSGAFGGNIAGALMQDKSLGTLGNSLAGIFGGGIGGWILSALGLLGHSGAAATSSGVDLTSILGNIASGGVGGGVLMAVIGLIKSAMNK